MFPDSDPAYLGISSLVLLARTGQALSAAGYKIGNIDATVVAEAPKLKPHIPEMRGNIARQLGLEEACVSIKATTEEGLGFTGAGAGIAAHAVALIENL
jgi:2-C-methyl-D-erythritol 2,4-cyclodiphosphate synthase